MIAGWKLAARMQKLEESPDFMSIVQVTPGGGAIGK